METILDRVRHTVRRRGLFTPGRRVLAAVSGGSDSVALLYLLRELAAAGELGMAGVVHLHHGLRGDDADEDASFCAALAARLTLPFETERLDVRALARAGRTSVEDAARRARHDFFGRAAGRLNADWVAVGHTKDDQAETLLLRLLRGAGTRGLGAIRPVAGRVVRPLIDVRRRDLRAWLAARGIEYREDPSNEDLNIPRNRVRHELLPYLGTHFGTGVVNVLAREADSAREDAAWLDEAAERAAADVVRHEPQGASLDRMRLQQLPPALQRRVVRLALEPGAGGRFVGFDHVASLIEVVPDGGPAHVDLPGQRAERAGSRLILRRHGTRTAPAGSFYLELPVPGEVVVPSGGWTVAVERATAPGLPAGLDRVVVDADRVGAPIAVRSRRPGDAILLPEVGGRKKLQDLFVDAKVPRHERDTVPLVTTADNRIVWIVGHAVAGEFRVTDRTAAMLILTARRSGGSV